MEQDELYMKEALMLAKEAEELDEVPVGALIVRDGKVIARAHNRRQTDKCATAHAEILAIEEACRNLGGWRLPGATLYVTLEPCAMCAGAAINARVERVVYGASDLRFGALGSLLNIAEVGLNHKLSVESGVMAEECRNILSEYFRRKRKKKDKSDIASIEDIIS